MISLMEDFFFSLVEKNYGTDLTMCLLESEILISESLLIIFCLAIDNFIAFLVDPYPKDLDLDVTDPNPLFIIEP